MDVVVVDGVLFASKILHDSITSLSSQDEKRNAAGKFSSSVRYFSQRVKKKFSYFVIKFINFYLSVETDARIRREKFATSMSFLDLILQC